MRVSRYCAYCEKHTTRPSAQAGCPQCTIEGNTFTGKGAIRVEAWDDETEPGISFVGNELRAPASRAQTSVCTCGKAYPEPHAAGCPHDPTPELEQLITRDRAAELLGFVLEPEGPPSTTEATGDLEGFIACEFCGKQIGVRTAELLGNGWYQVAAGAWLSTSAHGIRGVRCAGCLAPAQTPEKCPACGHHESTHCGAEDCPQHREPA